MTYKSVKECRAPGCLQVLLQGLCLGLWTPGIKGYSYIYIFIYLFVYVYLFRVLGLGFLGCSILGLDSPGVALQVRRMLVVVCMSVWTESLSKVFPADFCGRGLGFRVPCIGFLHRFFKGKAKSFTTGLRTRRSHGPPTQPEDPLKQDIKSPTQLLLKTYRILRPGLDGCTSKKKLTGTVMN